MVAVPTGDGSGRRQCAFGEHAATPMAAVLFVLNFKTLSNTLPPRYFDTSNLRNGFKSLSCASKRKQAFHQTMERWFHQTMASY